MRKDFIYAGFITLIWFLGVMAFLWVAAIEGGIALLSLLVLSVALLALGLFLREKGD